MSESFIEPESLNSTLVSLDAILDDDGAVRLLNKELSSYNFDGVIPTTASTILVNELQVGMSFLPIGETEGALRTVVKVEFDDPEMTNSPSNDYIISYLSPSGDIQSVTYDGSQNIEVYFEDWEDKVLGTKGWLITQEGNAIFSNVAVRGRIEATEGLIDGDLIVTGSLSTSETADTEGGVVFDSTGILAYDTDGNNTFWLDAATGDITIFGTPGDDLLTGEDVSDGGNTIISANRITTGSVTGRVFRSNSTMTPSSGTGVYLDGDGRVRFSDPDATFTFDSSGLNVTSTNATMTFNSTGLSISGAGVSIGGTVQIDGSNASALLTGTDVGPSGTTTISGDRITTGSIESSAPDFIWNGISTFSTQGTRFSVNDGQIISEQFRIDSAGNAEFGGTLVAADGTFSGTLSAVDGTFTGTLSGVDGTFEGTLSAGVSISAPLITLTNAGSFKSNASGQRVQIDSVNGLDTIAFYSSTNVLLGKIGTLNDPAFGIVHSGNQYFLNGLDSGGIISTTSRFSGPGTGLSGTATSLNIGGNAATATLATRATDANNLDSGATGGARITGNNVQVTSIGSGTTSDETLRRNSSNQMRAVAASSRKIKTDISLLEDLNVLDIDVVKYKYIDGYLDEIDQRKNKLIPGFIAEQVYEFLPIAVDLDENGDPKNWNERIIIPIMVKTIQDQQKLIDALKERIERLENNV